jgi:hypothetical protein
MEEVDIFYFNFDFFSSPFSAAGIMVCYAIDNLSSFTEIQSFKEKIDRVKETEPYALLVSFLPFPSHPPFPPLPSMAEFWLGINAT